jgi:hypothetical protein
MSQLANSGDEAAFIRVRHGSRGYLSGTDAVAPCAFRPQNGRPGIRSLPIGRLLRASQECPMPGPFYRLRRSGAA